jgi:hypothetical protein
MTALNSIHKQAASGMDYAIGASTMEDSTMVSHRKTF